MVLRARSELVGAECRVGAFKRGVWPERVQVWSCSVRCYYAITVFDTVSQAMHAHAQGVEFT